MICVADIMDNYDGSEMNNYRKSTITLKYMNHTLRDGVEGDVVEMGCYEGDTLYLMRYLLDAYKSDKKLYGYDSFVGLPHPSDEDKYDRDLYPEYSLDAFTMVADIEQLTKKFESRNLELPIIKKGWFKEINNYPCPISFAHFDGDMYESILNSFEKVYDKMSVGGIIVIDDYNWEVTPGVKKATEEFLKDKKENGKIKLDWEKGIMVKE